MGWHLGGLSLLLRFSALLSLEELQKKSQAKHNKQEEKNHWLFPKYD